MGQRVRLPDYGIEIIAGVTERIDNVGFPRFGIANSNQFESIGLLRGETTALAIVSVGFEHLAQAVGHLRNQRIGVVSVVELGIIGVGDIVEARACVVLV